MANVLFIGDIHGGHKNICNFRPQFNFEKNLKLEDEINLLKSKLFLAMDLL